MSHPVLEAAKVAFLQRLTEGSSVSAHTRNAQAIAKAWRSAVFGLDPERYAYEVPVRPDFDQRVDVLDRVEMCAFEFKVSGKNASSEFYRDVVKVLLWNEHHKEKIKKLVFITEGTWGRKYLDTPMPRAFVELLRKHQREVNIEYVELVAGVTPNYAGAEMEAERSLPDYRSANRRGA
jgi:hypothetical protein